MEMTTPVFSTAGQGEVDSRMEFPMERKFGQDVEALPQPNDARQASVVPSPVGGLTGYNTSERKMSSLLWPFP